LQEGDPSHLFAFARELDAIAPVIGEPEQFLRQRSTYFDTPGRQLFDCGYTLRIRQTGESRVQTVKATGESASLFARSEWETPNEQNQPVIDHSSPLASEFGENLTLEALFELELQRRI
jgi:inorganic triphosphatase YgiF